MVDLMVDWNSVVFSNPFVNQWFYRRDSNGFPFLLFNGGRFDYNGGDISPGPSKVPRTMDTVVYLLFVRVVPCSQVLGQWGPGLVYPSPVEDRTRGVDHRPVSTGRARSETGAPSWSQGPVT